MFWLLIYLYTERISIATTVLWPIYLLLFIAAFGATSLIYVRLIWLMCFVGPKIYESLA